MENQTITFSWLKDAIAHLQQTAAPQLVQIEADEAEEMPTFALYPNGEFAQLVPTIYKPDVLYVHSLDALSQMIHNEASKHVSTLFVGVVDHLSVSCYGEFDPEKRWLRTSYYHAKATDVPGWQSSVSMGFEEMLIALRTRFQETPDVQYLMRLLSDICTGAQVTYNDNGVATMVVTKKGIALQGNEAIRPIVTLRPYRTFQEVDQPESSFLVRVNERGITFVEADGGMWKLQARQTVKAYLEKALEDLNNVIVML